MVWDGNTCYGNCKYNDKKQQDEEQVALAGNDNYGNSGQELAAVAETHY